MIVVGFTVKNMERLGRLPGQFKRAARLAVPASLMVMDAELKKSIKENLNNTRARGYYQRKTGHLAQSLSHELMIGEDTTIGVIGTRLKYARIHEEGGVIVPTRAQKLTVPYPSGRPVPSGRVLKGRSNAFIRKDVIFLKDSEGNPVPVYSLRRSVTIPARHWITKGLQSATPRVLAILQRVGFNVSI